MDAGSGGQTVGTSPREHSCQRQHPERAHELPQPFLERDHPSFCLLPLVIKPTKPTVFASQNDRKRLG